MTAAEFEFMSGKIIKSKEIDIMIKILTVNRFFGHFQILRNVQKFFSWSVWDNAMFMLIVWKGRKAWVYNGMALMGFVMTVICTGG